MWTITQRVYADRQELWLKWNGTNIMVFAGPKESTAVLLEEAAKYIQIEDADDEQQTNETENPSRIHKSSTELQSAGDQPTVEQRQEGDSQDAG